MFHLSGTFYFSAVDVFSDYTSKSLDIVSVNHISMGYICNEIKPVHSWLLGLIRIDRGGAHIDVVRNVVCPTSATGNNEDKITWMKIHGAIGTNMEHAMLESLYRIDAVSTGRIFAEAAKQGIPIHILDNTGTLEADLAQISAHYVVKNHIRSYVNAGYVATIPQHSVKVGEWVGQGWIVMDEATGAAGYMICGGLYGDNTVLSGGSLSQALLNLFLQVEHLLHALLMSGGFWVSGYALIYVSQVILNAYILLFPLALLVGAFGVLLMYMALIAFVKTLQGYIPSSLTTRRRRNYNYGYAYA